MKSWLASAVKCKGGICVGPLPVRHRCSSQVNLNPALAVAVKVTLAPHGDRASTLDHAAARWIEQDGVGVFDLCKIGGQNLARADIESVTRISAEHTSCAAAFGSMK